MDDQTNYRIHLAKESFKFSATHFTVLDSGHAERLHGHNYQVEVEIDVDSLDAYGMAFEFNSVKNVIRQLTAAWDERVLLPAHCPALTIRPIAIEGTPHVQVVFQKRQYQFPFNEVALIDSVNITAEELARLFTLSLIAAALLPPSARSIRVTILETAGQGASFFKALGGKSK